MEATAVMLDFEGEGTLLDRARVVVGGGGNNGERRVEVEVAEEEVG